MTLIAVTVAQSLQLEGRSLHFSLKFLDETVQRRRRSKRKSQKEKPFFLLNTKRKHKIPNQMNAIRATYLSLFLANAIFAAVFKSFGESEFVGFFFFPSIFLFVFVISM